MSSRRLAISSLLCDDDDANDSPKDLPTATTTPQQHTDVFGLDALVQAASQERRRLSSDRSPTTEYRPLSTPTSTYHHLPPVAAPRHGFDHILSPTNVDPYQHPAKKRRYSDEREWEVERERERQREQERERERQREREQERERQQREERLLHERERMAMGQIGFGRSGHEYQPLSPAVPGPSLRQSPALSSNSARSPALSLSNITSPTLRSSRPTSSRDSFPPSSSFAPTFPPSVRDPTLRVTSPSIFPQSFSSRDRVTSPSVLHSREAIVRSPPTFQQQHHAFAIPPLSHREAIPVQRDSRDMLVHRDSIPSQSTSHTDSVTMRSRRDSMGSIPISSHSQREVASREALGRDPMSHTDYRARRDSIGSHPSQIIPSSQPSHRDSLAQIPTHRESLPSHRDSHSSHRDSIITHAHRDSISSQEGIPRIHRDSISSLSSHSSNHEPVSSHLLHRSPVLPRDPRESLFERETGQLHRERDMISGRDPRGRSFPMQIPPISTHPSITHHRDRSHSITVAGLPPRENVVTVPPREHVALPREHVGNREHVREHVIIDQITREHTAHTPTITPIPSREQQPVPAFPPISIQERVTSPIYHRDGAPTRDRVTSSREHNASPILSREHVTSPVSARERIPSPLVAKEYVPSHSSARESVAAPRERLSIATHFDPLHERAISPISARERVPSPTVARERPPSPVVVRERHPSPIITRERFPSPLTTKDREGSSVIQHANEREERVVSPISSRDLMNTEVIIPRERPSIFHPEPRREKTSTSNSISSLLQRDRVPSTSSLTLSLDIARHPQPSSSERIASPIASSPPKEKKTVSPNVSPPSKQPISPPIVPVSSPIIPLPTPTQRVVSPIIPTPTSMTKRSPPGSQTGRAIAHAHVYGKVEEHTPKKVEMIDEVKVERRESVVPPTPAPSTPMKDEPMPLAGSEVETKQAKHPKHKESSHLHDKDKVTEQPPKRPSSATAHKEKLTPPKRPLSATSHKDGMTHEDAHEWFLEHFADSPAPKKKKPNHSSSTSLEDDLTKELERELADVDTPMADINEEEAERMEVDVEDELLSLVQDGPAKEKLVLPPVPPVRKASMKKKASEERDRESMPPPATTTVKTKRKPGPKPKTSKPTTKTAAKPGPKGKKEAPVPLKGKAASISVSRSRSTSVMPGDAQEEGQDEKTEEKEKEVEDDKVYCVCKRKYDEGRTMIGCDKCDDWYHMQCVNMSELEVELVDQFICPPCIQKNPQLNLKTTYKTRCLNGLDDPDPSSTEACHRPSKGALSKYCSPECGIKYMRRRIDAYTARGGSREVLWSKVKDAERREGVVVHCQTGAVMKSKTKAEREIERLAGPLEAIGKARAGLRRAMECVLWRERVWELACQRAEAGGDICGWDQRICFGEEEWEEWGDGVEESYAADADDNDAEWWCPGPKDCERHHGWQSIRQDDINNEKTKGEEAIMKLTTKEREIRKQMEDLVGAESADIDRDAKPGPLKSNGKVINVNGDGVKNVKGKVKVNGDDKKTLKRKKR